MSGASKFDDLFPRVTSAVVMVAVGFGAVWIGGPVFLALIGVIVGLMVWELARMVAPDDPQTAIGLAVLAGTAVVCLRIMPLGLGLPLIFLPALIGVARFEVNRRVFAVYSVLISLAGFGLFVLRMDYGLIWMLWLAAVVVATDILGYFAGRIIGGPKFWPKISPKKTWSGTVAGWIGATVVAVLFAGFSDGMLGLIVISVALSMASQMGDIAESAMKRRAGVKDSSALIPGHGGLLDRFDGMLAASILLLVIEQIVDFPPLPVAGL